MASSFSTENKTKKDSDILYRIANDDTTAVAQCLDVYGGLIWALARKYCHSREDAEDAVQEVFIDIWRYAGRFDAAKSPEISFIMLIARRRLIDRMRKSNNRPQLFFSEEILENQSSDEHKKLQMHVELKDVLEGLDKLKPQQKAIIEMAIFSGMSHREISQTIGIPFGTVKSQIRRGLQNIRQFVGIEI